MSVEVDAIIEPLEEDLLSFFDGDEEYAGGLEYAMSSVYAEGMAVVVVVVGGGEGLRSRFFEFFNSFFSCKGECERSNEEQSDD